MGCATNARAHASQDWVLMWKAPVKECAVDQAMDDTRGMLEVMVPAS